MGAKKLPVEQRLGERLNLWLEQKNITQRLREWGESHPFTVSMMADMSEDMRYSGGIYWAVYGFANNSPANVIGGVLLAGTGLMDMYADKIKFMKDEPINYTNL